MKHLVVTFCLCLLFFQGSGQALRKISGRISGPNGEPVEFANVYINNTSSYCLSDTAGYFELKIPPKLTDFQLVISRIGYEELRTDYKGINKSMDISVILKDDKSLNEVMVKARQDPAWRKRWATFKRGLLGESSFADKCVIENPEDVELTMEDKKTILATTRAPLRITNHGLGYSIIVSIQGFKTDGYITYAIDSKYFIPLVAKDEREVKRWEKNRLSAYKNSFRHFLVSMIKNPDDQRFEIYYQPEIQTSFTHRMTVSEEIKAKKLFRTNTHAFVTVNSDSTEFFFASRVPLLVFLKDRYQKYSPYADSPYEFAQVELPRRFIAFNKYGWINRSNGLFLHNYWGREGIADMLPYDYYPEEKMQEETGITMDDVENKTFRKDSVAFRPVMEIVYVRPNRTSPELTENKAEISSSAKPDYEVPAQTLKNSSSMLELLRDIPGLTIANKGVKVDAVTFKDAAEKSVSNSPCLILNGQAMCDRETVLLTLNTINIKNIKRMGLMNYGNGGLAVSVRAIVINTMK